MIRLLDSKITGTRRQAILLSATQDIRFNNIGFGKRTTWKEVVDIVNRCRILYEKVYIDGT